MCVCVCVRMNAACCFKQILEETLNKTAVIRPPVSHLSNHSNKLNETYCWRRKYRLINNVPIWTPTHGHASVG